MWFKMWKIYITLCMKKDVYDNYMFNALYDKQ